MLQRLLNFEYRLENWIVGIQVRKLNLLRCSGAQPWAVPLLGRKYTTLTNAHDKWWKKEQVLCGLLDGLGPETIIHFQQFVLIITKKQYNASTDQDHVYMIHLNSRSYHGTLRQRRNSGPELEKMAMRLVAAKVDYVVCVCNTAHAFSSYVVRGCGDVPLLSIIELTANTVRKRIEADGGIKKCGILATNGCVCTKMHEITS